MISLTAWTIKIPPSLERQRIVDDLCKSDRRLLVLDTCQRLEIFGDLEPIQGVQVDEQYRDGAAFERLARIAAGLESRILGELEVLGQVRDAYKRFRREAAAHDLSLDRYFQAALALARKARRESGIDQEIISLSGLAGRELLRRVSPGAPVAVIGSGSIAASAIRHLWKRGSCPIRVSSRCPDNAMSLAASVGGFGAGLDELAPLLEDVEGILCATAAPHPVLYAHHIEAARRPLHIIDLGVPADCAREVIAMDHVDYLPLEGVEAKAQGNLAERARRAEIAARIIREGAEAWAAQAR